MMRLRYCFLGILLSISWTLQAAIPHARLLTVADLHFDPLASCHSKPCPLAGRLTEAPVTEWERILLEASDQQPSQYHEDTNFPLLQSFLRSIKQQHPDFVVVMGDVLGHEVISEYQRLQPEASVAQFVIKTHDFIAHQLRKTLPQTSMYYLLGNNDTIRQSWCLKNDYCAVKNPNFRQRIAKVWRILIHDPKNQQSFLENFPEAGYYRIHLAKPAMDLLMLNTVLFSWMHQGDAQHVLALKQLAWLKQQFLDHASPYYVFMHIPPGVDAFTTLHTPWAYPVPFWQQTYRNTFVDALSTSRVLGLFAAHSHKDGVQWLGEGNQGHILLDNPSVSPIYGNSPAYKVYQISPLGVLNSQTYRLSLPDTSEWPLRVDFQRDYTSLTPSYRVLDFINSLVKQPRSEITARYLQDTVGWHDAAPIVKQASAYLCAMRHFDEVAYSLCWR